MDALQLWESTICAKLAFVCIACWVGGCGETEPGPVVASGIVKLDSHIVLALKKSRSEPPFDKPTALDPDLAIHADGRVLVDLDATVSGELLAQIEQSGGKVINSFEASRAIRALVPLVRMEALASRADVKFIAPAAEATADHGGSGDASSIEP